jgi:hypothetical protein
MMLWRSPLLKMPTVMTLSESGGKVRERIVCKAMTISEAVTIGS